MINFNIFAIITAFKYTTTIETPSWGIDYKEYKYKKLVKILFYFLSCLFTGNRQGSNCSQMVHNSSVIISRKCFVSSKTCNSIHSIWAIVASSSLSKLKKIFFLFFGFPKCSQSLWVHILYTYVSRGVWIVCFRYQSKELSISESQLWNRSLATT